MHRFPPDEDVPLDGVVPPGWIEAVIATDAKGRPRIDRINYEICVLQTLRDKLRCKEVWVEGADRYRNPDEDLPADFAAQRTTYYERLDLPLDSETFVRGLQDEMTAALTALDRAMPQNAGVAILPKRNGWIKVSPLAPLPEPPTLTRLKGEIGQRWPMTSLLGHAQGGRSACRLHAGLHQRRLTRSARLRDRATASVAVPLRTGNQRGAQAHRRRRARRELR